MDEEFSKPASDENIFLSLSDYFSHCDDVMGEWFKRSRETLFAVAEQSYRSQLKSRDEMVAHYKEQSERWFEIAQAQQKKIINQNITLNKLVGGDLMTDNINNIFENPNIANFANKVSGNARQQANQYIYTPAQKQTLAEAAAEIQRLLKQLEQKKPDASDSEKIAYVNDETTPSFKRRAFSALQAGGEAAIEEFLDNPYVNVGKAIVKGWVKPE